MDKINEQAPGADLSPYCFEVDDGEEPVEATLPAVPDYHKHPISSINGKALILVHSASSFGRSASVIVASLPVCTAGVASQSASTLLEKF